MANPKNISTTDNNISIPTDFLTSLGDALGNKLGDFLIKVIDKLFPPDGNS